MPLQLLVEATSSVKDLCLAAFALSGKSNRRSFNLLGPK